MVKFAQKHEAKEKIAFFEKGEKVISECSEQNVSSFHAVMVVAIC